MFNLINYSFKIIGHFKYSTYICSKLMFRFTELHVEQINKDYLLNTVRLKLRFKY